MNPVLQQNIDQMRSVVKEVLGSSASDVFLKRLDVILNAWAAGNSTASQACEKVQKTVGLFIDEDKAREIGDRCAPMIMRESAAIKK